MLVVEFCSPVARPEIAGNDIAIGVMAELPADRASRMPTPGSTCPQRCNRFIYEVSSPHGAGCSRQRIIKQLEALTGGSVWSAYQPGSTGRDAGAPPASTSGLEHRMRFRLLVLGAIIAMSVAPITLGNGMEATALNVVGLSWTATAT